MELKELYEKTLKLLNVEDAEEIPNALYSAVMTHNYTIHKGFNELTRDLSRDYLQAIFQYYLADRKEKKQDYTPPSQGRLLARITTVGSENVCLDLCAGSGSLTIQKWFTNPKLKFICKELDSNVIPLLLFNLSIRNIEGEVVQENLITEEVLNVYKLKKGEEFSIVEKAAKQTLQADICISNPPFNMRWVNPGFLNIQSRFFDYGVPPESNANLLFLLTGLRDARMKASFILPNSAFTGSNEAEKEIIKNLVNKNLIETLVLCPGDMFESTGISTTIITLNKNKENATVAMVNASEICIKEVREQRGQRGDKSKTSRVYKKEVNTFSEENINVIIEKLKDKQSEVSIETISKKDYCLAVNRCLQPEFKEIETREYKYIVSDLNRVRRQKNAFKLTINETVAKGIGFELDGYKKVICDDEAKLNEILKDLAGQGIVTDDYISFSKIKNEIKFENKSKDEIAPIFSMLLNSWRQNILFLNVEENRYLAELRDKLLPDIMSGKIQI